jgi:hypothetical protein
MKRNFGLGDGIILGGLVTMLVFLIIALITSFDGGGSRYSDFGGGGTKFSWPHVNSIILLLLVIGAGMLFFWSFVNPKMLTMQYLFAGFMLLIHIPPNFASYASGNAALNFYVFVGALLVGAGTYLIQQGTGLITGEKK